MATTENRSGKKRRPKKRKAAPRKNAATREVKSAKQEDIVVTEDFIIKGDRKIPRVHDGDLPPIPSLPDAQNHFRKIDQAKKATEELPEIANFVPAPVDPRFSPPKEEKPKFKTFAEQTGAARRDEVQHEKAARMRRTQSEGDSDSVRSSANLGNPLVAMCPPELREPQPADFRPSELLRQLITAFCEHPNLQNGAAIARRVHYDMLDSPSIHVSDAEIAGLEPVFILGRQIESSATKRYCGYAAPSPDTYKEAEEKVLQLLQAWSEGKEAVQKKAPQNVERMILKDTDLKGRTITTRPVIEKFHYRQTLRIFRPMDDAGQICIVVI